MHASLLRVYASHRHMILSTCFPTGYETSRLPGCSLEVISGLQLLWHHTASYVELGFTKQYADIWRRHDCRGFGPGTAAADCAGAGCSGLRSTPGSGQ